VREESCAVTVRHLLEFASGWDWRETYEGQSPVTSSVLAMLYGEGRRDMARFVANHPLRDPPGTSWQYSSGETNVLAAVVGAALAERHGERFPWAVLFDPIGMSATWERDAAGTFGGSSYVWATPRHLARFGWLYRNDGCWNGRRILPEDWIADSTRVVDGLRAKPVAWTDDDVQGRQIWLNIAVPEIGQVERPWPSAPEDAYAALGHWRQSITVVPSRDTVIVRVADDRDHTFDHDTFLGLALALVPDEGGTP
jgi:CubicO group peptidase (beta-lactamase class C family)